MYQQKFTKNGGLRNEVRKGRNHGNRKAKPGMDRENERLGHVLHSKGRQSNCLHREGERTMKKYRLKPRFYVIAITTGLLITGFSIVQIDAACTEKLESGEIIKPAAVYAQEIEQPEEPAEPGLESLGEYKITHYCSCPQCCGVWAENRPVDENGQEIVYTASGARAEAGKTIAVDPAVIPLGSTVIIDGQEYIAQDTGGAIQGNRIDIYCSSHQEALELGVITAEVWMEV